MKFRLLKKQRNITKTETNFQSVGVDWKEKYVQSISHRKVKFIKYEI